MPENNSKKLKIQEAQYEFPYHYIPHFTSADTATRHRLLGWGFEYLCYQRHIRETVLQMEAESVLEVGCGDGYFIGSLGEQIPRRVGADFSEKAIGFARAFNPDVRFYAGDAAELDEEFDVVCAIEVLEHIPDEEVMRFLRVLFDRVRPGGNLVISVPSVVLPLHKKHFRHYTSGMLRKQVLEASPTAEVVNESYVCRIPRWMAFYNRLTANRHWLFDIHVMSDWVWRRLWRKHRVGDENTGRHVVGVFRKADL